MESGRRRPLIQIKRKDRERTKTVCIVEFLPDSDVAQTDGERVDRIAPGVDEDGFEGEVVGRGCGVAWLVGCADLTTRSPFACTCDCE